MDQDQGEQDPVVGEHGVDGGEAGNGQAAADQHPSLAQAVGEPARQRRGQRGGVGEEAEEEPRRELAAAQLEDVVRRGGQELEGGQEHREGEPAHEEEAGSEEGKRRFIRREALH